jgi:cell division protein ZapE
MLASFCRLAPDGATEGEELEVNGRGIATIRCADGVVWFHFRDLCEGPRSPADYIDIARCFHKVIITEVPEMGPDDADKVLRFVHLIDEFYERNVNLIISAAALPTALYCGERFTLQFQRTVSRLQEMQSRDYLARKHLP